MKSYLSRKQFAQRIGVKEDTLNRYKLPEPDAVIGEGDPRPKYGWTPETIDKWHESRPSETSIYARALHQPEAQNGGTAYASELARLNERRREQSHLSRRQVDVLFVVSQREPVSAADVAYSLLSTPPAERSRLDNLARRGLVDRQYTGLKEGDRVGYVLTQAGREALDALDVETEE